MPRRKTTLPKCTHPNQIITWDLKEWGKGYILWMVCSFSRFLKGVYIANMEMETVMEAIYYSWVCNFGIPSEGFWTDNGTEFKNSVVKELVEHFKLQLNFVPPYSPWCNGLNEKNHHLIDVIIRKVQEQDKTLSLECAIKLACWMHNTNANRLE